jgi:hypothetical protein
MSLFQSILQFTFGPHLTSPATPEHLGQTMILLHLQIIVSSIMKYLLDGVTIIVHGENNRV